MRTQFNILLQGVSSKSVSIGTAIVCSVIMAPLLISHLGSESYGLYAVLGSVMAYLFVLDFGSGLAVPKYVAEYRARKDIEGLRRLISSFFFAFLGVSLGLILLAGVCMPFVPHVLKTSPGLVRTAEVVFFTTVVNFSLLLPFGVLTGLLYGIQKAHITYWLDTLFYIVNTLAAYILVTLGHGLIAVALGTLGARIVVTLLLVWFARTKCPEGTLRMDYFDWATLKQLLSPSAHFFVIQVAALIIFTTDNIIISSFLGVSAVTAYAIVFKLWRVLERLIISAARILLPHISELDARDNRTRLRSLHIQLTKYSLLLALVALVCMATFGEQVIGLWVGPENFAGTPLLLCIGLLLLLNTVVHCSSTLLMGMAQHKLLAYMFVLEGLVNLGLSILLVSKVGVLGVGMATVIARLLFSFWFAPWYACRMLEQDLWEYARGVAPALFPVVPAVGLALVLSRLSASPILLIVGGSLAIATTYLAIFYKLSLSRVEQQLLWNRLTGLLVRA